MQGRTSSQRPRGIRARSFEFACRIVKLHQYLQKCGGTEREIGRQLLRSGTSIGANLEEADAGQSKSDFISKCSIALKEARETHYWLRLLKDSKLMDEGCAKELLDRSEELIRMLTSIVKTTQTGA